MKITYTGRQVELSPAQLKKLQSQFTKIGKLLDGKREHEAHVILSVERHLQKAEVTVNYHHHQLVGLGANGDLFNAIHLAAEKLEKQVLFFFQAEDGIRDADVTGVQTCALPI